MDSLFETLKNLGPARLGVMLLALLFLVVFFIFIAVRSSAPTMTLLYGDLSPADSSAISGQLDLAKIQFQLSDNGKEVLVSQRHIGKARMLLAAEGLPSNGNIGYEIFDQKQRFGTTSFVQNINKLRALEGELSRTIRSLDVVKTARVHLVLPQRELFSRDSRAASASIFVNLRKSNQIGDEQILAMQHLVASAVPGLKPDQVAVIDGEGSLLARGGGKEGGSILGDDEDVSLKYEQRLMNNIEDMVGRVVGYGKVRVNVTADLDFDVISRSSESYDPEGQVVRSTQNITEEEQDNSGGGNQSVSVQNNLPGLPGDSSGTGGSSGSKSSRSEDVVNYEISKTVESIVRESGEVLKISVAVLVDGYYEDIPVKVVEGEEVDEGVVPEKRYVPRSQEELDKIALLVKSSIGFDEARGDIVEVINMKFSRIESVDDTGAELIFGLLERHELVQFSETLMLSIVALLIVLLVLRPLVNHVAAASKSIRETKIATEEENVALLASQVESQAQLAPPDGLGGGDDMDDSLDVQNVEGRIKASSLKKVSDLVEGNPAEAVSVIRGWMEQES